MGVIRFDLFFLMMILLIHLPIQAQDIHFRFLYRIVALHATRHTIVPFAMRHMIEF